MFHSLLWLYGIFAVLGSVVGSFSCALAINERVQLVGGSHAASGFYHAFLMKEVRLCDLWTLGGGSRYGIPINEGGQVVGCGGSGWGEGLAVLGG